jgi:hypothetical protein
MRIGLARVQESDHPLMRKVNPVPQQTQLWFSLFSSTYATHTLRYYEKRVVLIFLGLHLYQVRELAVEEMLQDVDVFFE